MSEGKLFGTQFMSGDYIDRTFAKDFDGDIYRIRSKKRYKE